jgi:hypothetical protein
VLLSLIWLADEQVARLRELKKDAARATETMRRVDPTAAPVRVPLRGWNACTRQLARLEQQIAHEMGQDAAHIDAIARDQNALFRLRQLGLIPTEQLKKQARELRGEPPEPSREERERENREESRARTEAMMQQLMASLHLDRLRRVDDGRGNGQTSQNEPEVAFPGLKSRNELMKEVKDLGIKVETTDTKESLAKKIADHVA